MLTSANLRYFIAIGKFTGKWKKSADNVNTNVTQNKVGTPRLHHTDIKVLKSCFTVVCFFLITLAPPCLGALLTAVGDYPPAEVHKVAPYFIFSGILVNPIIYGIMNPQFRDAFKKVFSCCSCGNDHSNQTHARITAVMMHTKSNEARWPVRGKLLL